MRQFLQKEFGTSSIAQIDLQELKAVLEGAPVMERLGHRKQNDIGGVKPIIQRGSKYRKDNALANSYEKSQKNDSFGFRCLKMSVSEASDYASVTIQNKYGIAA